jgi:hypothetical protein
MQITDNILSKHKLGGTINIVFSICNISNGVFDGSMIIIILKLYVPIIVLIIYSSHDYLCSGC